jgi:hypothetical protein
MTTRRESRGLGASTGIVHVRLSGEREDLTRLAAAITALPGLTVTAMSLRENYRDPGMRAYLTVVMPQDADKGNDHAQPDA